MLNKENSFKNEIDENFNKMIDLSRINTKKKIYINNITCHNCKYLLSLRNNTICSKCDKLFCSECSSILINDKNTNECYNFKDNFDKILYKKLEKLDILCENEPRGCKEIIIYKDLFKHEKKMCLRAD